MTDDPTRPTATPPPMDLEESPTATAAGPQSGSAMALIMAGGAGRAATAGSRLRWVLALGVVALAAIVAVGAIVVLGSKPTPPALTYIPADAMVVVELRPDLPGDQVQKLGNLLAHFPGFRDQATLPDKLDQALSRLVSQGSKGSVDYVTDLKPWLSGPAFVAVRQPAEASAADPSAFKRGLASLTTAGAVSCDAPFKDQSVTHESFKGFDLFESDGSACVLDGHQALVGDTQSVKDALDAHAAGSGLDRSATYQKARAAAKGDQLATVYVNGSAYASFSAGLLQGLGTKPGAPLMPAGFMPAFPEWAIATLRAEDDAVVLDAFAGAPLPASPGASAGPSMLPLPAAHPSELIALAPTNTVAFIEAQGAGVSLQNLLTQLRTMPELAQPLQMLDGAGGAGQLIGWIQDAGILVVNAPDGPTGGVLLAAPDEATATQRVATLTGLLALAGMGGNGVESRQSTVGGVQVTTITITDIASLVPPGQLPPGVDVPANAKVEFSIAAKGKVVVLGAGEAFMNAVLTVQSGSGLVDQAAYKHATARALSGSSFTAYVAVRDIVAMAEKMLPQSETAKWDSDMKPYLAPFEAISITSAPESGGVHARYTISVSNP
jgi:hypothetical protein